MFCSFLPTFICVYSVKYWQLIYLLANIVIDWSLLKTAKINWTENCICFGWTLVVICMLKSSCWKELSVINVLCKTSDDIPFKDCGYSFFLTSIKWVYHRLNASKTRHPDPFFFVEIRSRVLTFGTFYKNN